MLGVKKKSAEYEVQEDEMYLELDRIVYLLDQMKFTIEKSKTWLKYVQGVRLSVLRLDRIGLKRSIIVLILADINRHLPEYEVKSLAFFTR